MKTAVHRLALPLCCAALAAACLSPGETDQVNIPAGSTIYTIALM